MRTSQDAGFAPLTIEQRKLNLESLEKVWTTVRDRHWDPTLGGVDWSAAHQTDPLPPEAIDLPEEIEILAYRPRTEIRDVEADDKDRPTLKRRTTPQTKK